MQKAHDSSYNDYWRNKPNITTPIVQDQLNRVETTIDTIDDRVVTFDTTKANQTDLLADIKNVSFDSSTGTFTFTKQNNTTIVIDTDIEKIAVNFDYDNDPESAHYQNLIITLDDGTVKYVDMSALITEYEFTDSSAIHFTINSGSVSASIIDGSITEEKLQPNFLADCRAAKTAAETAETNAETAETGAQGYKRESEAWAVGTKDGVPVPPSADQYNNNAKYWAAQARAIVGDKVDSFNGRTGTVVAEDGDYPSDYIVPETGAIPGQVPVVRNVGTGQEVKLRYVNEDLDIGLKPHIIVISETGSTVTLTKGTKVIYASETSPEHFEADVTEFGTWVIDSVLGGDDAQVSLVVDAVKIYTVDDSHWHADITVTYPTGGTCSCSKSGTTTLYATGSPYTFTVHESGTYTITATANGETYTTDVEITTSGQTESLTIPEGSTVTPTDSVATLLSCAGIHDTSITTISDLLADTTTLLAVINSNNAIDYMVRSKTWAGVGLVPVMTSDTTPSGVAFVDEEYSADRKAYLAFDGDSTSSAISAFKTSATEYYIGYEFTEERVISNVALTVLRTSGSITSTSLKVQAYINGSWVDIDTITISTPSNDAVTATFTFNEVATNKIRLSGTRQLQSGNQYIPQFAFVSIQFYNTNICEDSTAMSYIGLNNYAANTLLADSTWLNAICNSTYFESVLNAKVPTMTSNTTPSGVASASSGSESAWYAFDNALTNWHSAQTVSAGGSQWIQYQFDSAVSAKRVEIEPYARDTKKRLKNYKIQGSNDGSNFTDIHSGTLPNVTTSGTVYETTTVIISNSNSYLYYRLYCVDSYDNAYEFYINKIQFYGREDV